MNDCEDCKERMLPNDPSKPLYVGFNSKFKGVSSISGCLPSLCNSCPNYPGIWNVPEKDTTIPIKVTTPTTQVDTITQLRGQMRYFNNRFNEHLDRSKSKKRDRL